MGHGNIKNTKTIEDALVNNSAISSFNEKITKLGFTPNSLPDVLAGFIVLNLQAVTGKNVSDHIKGALKYRDDLKLAMQKSDKINDWDNARRQKVCESMALYASMAIGATEVNRDEKVIQNIRQTAINITGIDIINFTLTDEGFKKK